MAISKGHIAGYTTLAGGAATSTGLLIAKEHENGDKITNLEKDLEKTLEENRKNKEDFEKQLKNKENLLKQNQEELDKWQSLKIDDLDDQQTVLKRIRSLNEEITRLMEDVQDLKDQIKRLEEASNTLIASLLANSWDQDPRVWAMMFYTLPHQQFMNCSQQGEDCVAMGKKISEWRVIFKEVKDSLVNNVRK